MSIEGKTLCFSGTLVTQTRAEATKLAKKHGAKVTGSVSGKTDILVIGPTGAGSKVQVAESKGVAVWTEEEFNAACGIATGAKKKAQAKKSASPKKKKAKDEPDDAPTPKKAKKAPAAKTPPKKASAKKVAPATPAQPGSGARRVMSAVPSAHDYTVHEDFDVKLMLSDSLHANSNKFYKLQLLRDGDGDFFVATNWGRLGEPGQSQLKGPHDEDKGIIEFGKVFRNKTKNTWGEPFERYNGKYQLVETTVEDGEGGGDDAALGRLTESQIHKGQHVLKEIRFALEGKGKKKNDVLGELSNDFYSLIPTKSGRQRPPRLDNLDIVQEKEGLLEFWLRMGFEDMQEVDIDGSPIEGMYELPVPSSLSGAAAGITDSVSIKQSRDRGKELSKKKAGGPVKSMGPELYGAILLYTGNSIYRELNRCLRTEWKSVPKYWKYLRMFGVAMGCLPSREVTLWRGIAADLYSEYEEGKIITWWSVSSCTASKEVAQGFMGQLGGSAATFLTLHTKTAVDISGLSFYPHERESLLLPGTKLRVLKRQRKGKVAEIEVEEVTDEDSGEE